MKIAIIGPAYPFRGGLAAFSERLALALQQSGHEVIIYTFKVQYPQILFPGKTQYTEGEKPKDLIIERCLHSTNPLNWIKVGKKIRAAKPDLVLVKFWLPFMAPALGTVLRKIRKNKHTQSIAVIHNMIPHESRPGDRILTRYFVKQVDAFLAMSETVLKDLDKFDSDKPRALSPHPIYDNFGEIAPQKEAQKRLGLDQNKKYILFFGLIRPYKGLDLLLEAFADKRFRNSDIRLIVAGEYYTDKNHYTEIIKKSIPPEDIRVVDQYIPDEQVADFFNACSLVIQPYKSATQSGVTQIAYHFNKPMVVTNVGNLPVMCPDGKVGFVVRPESAEIAEATLRFFEGNYAKPMEENIKEEKKKYSWDILCKNIVSLKEKIHNRKES